MDEPQLPDAPVNLTGFGELPRGAAPGGGAVEPVPSGGYFQVDLDRLPQLLVDLEAIRDSYQSIQARSASMRELVAPGNDLVSTGATAELSRWAGDEPGQLGWAAQQARDRVQEMIEQVATVLESYGLTEECNALRPSSTDSVQV